MWPHFARRSAASGNKERDWRSRRGTGWLGSGLTHTLKGSEHSVRDEEISALKFKERKDGRKKGNKKQKEKEQEEEKAKEGRKTGSKKARKEAKGTKGKIMQKLYQPKTRSPPPIHTSGFASFCFFV